MNALLLTLISLGGLNGPTTTINDSGVNVSSEGNCDSCETGRCGKHSHEKDGGVCGPMPQSCYESAYGCYPGTRFMNRYPAFHGTYYRRPYNYRNVFDYPWHAEMHEPTSMFSFHVENEQVAPPTPIPAAQLEDPLHRDIRQAIDSGIPTPARNAATSQMRTLRR